MLIDLTLPVKHNPQTMSTNKKHIVQENGTEYDGIVHNFSFSGMTSTYIDFPGHIAGCEDGTDAANYELEKLYQVKTALIRLDRDCSSGKVCKEDLLTSVNVNLEKEKPDAIIINALGSKRFDEIKERSVWLSTEAAEWLVSLGIHLIISDIYESAGIHGVFGTFFKGGVSTVCCPVNLEKINKDIFTVTCLPAKFEKSQQLPCRLIAEV
ncbi:MAG: cyclase family protein [Planctomycetota bacterium]|jgi:kynurenine formamidase